MYVEKNLPQQAFRETDNWDEILDAFLARAVVLWWGDLHNLSAITVPWWIVLHSDSVFSIDVFSDALAKHSCTGPPFT